MEEASLTSNKYVNVEIKKHFGWSLYQRGYRFHGYGRHFTSNIVTTRVPLGAHCHDQKCFSQWPMNYTVL